MSKHDVVIVGGGAAGIATAASLLNRQQNLDLVIVEPATKHYYQPGWTLVGGGVFNAHETERQMDDVIPRGAKWKKARVTTFQPEKNTICLDTGENISYDVLVVAPGLKLNWAGVDGLEEALGKNGVTSNYRYDLAPYTWELVQSTQKGGALFTQPPMPIKCAGAPQKAMYLACDAWRRKGVLQNMDVAFHNAGGALFGVKDYVPALMEYVKAYNIDLHFFETLKAIDGTRKTAIFERQKDGKRETIEREFAMIHVCPPQVAPDFIASSSLVNDAGWLDVNQYTLSHKKYDNIFGLGDVTSTPNAKTAAAVRQQAPIVAVNILQHMSGKNARALYNGYGSCPLTVARGKIVLAEFGYEGKILPSFPTWLLNGMKPTKRAWFLKEKILPMVYWNAMLKGKEWLVQPKLGVQPD